jgi:hypothetical protein
MRWGWRWVKATGRGLELELEWATDSQSGRPSGWGLVLQSQLRPETQL